MNKPLRWLLVLVVTQLVMGCATVKPYEKENLADPIMTISSAEALRELKWLEAREGSTGGAGGAGGGCACK